MRSLTCGAVLLRTLGHLSYIGGLPGFQKRTICSAHIGGGREAGLIGRVLGACGTRQDSSRHRASSRVMREYRAAQALEGLEHILCYAVKANNNLHIMKHLQVFFCFPPSHVRTLGCTQSRLQAAKAACRSQSRVYRSIHL